MPGVELVRAPGFIAAVAPGSPIFENALLLEPGALGAVIPLYGARRSAVWTRRSDAAGRAAATAAGLAFDTWTAAMALDELPAASGGVGGSAELSRVAAVNDVPDDLLDGAEGPRGWAVREDGADVAALLTHDEEDDCGVFFVATRPHARRRGLATRLTLTALAAARARGCRTATLQAAPGAEGLYRRLGCRVLDVWEEWTPPRR